MKLIVPAVLHFLHSPQNNELYTSFPLLKDTVIIFLYWFLWFKCLHVSSVAETQVRETRMQFKRNETHSRVNVNHGFSLA